MLRVCQNATLLVVPMNYTITEETLKSLADCWSDPTHRLNWNSVFVLPAWLKVWWQEFGHGSELYLTAVRQGERVIGIAPLKVREGRASFIGSADVCDYLDFVVAPGREDDFFSILLDDLRVKGIGHLDLVSLRPDSTVLTHLVAIAQSRSYEVSCQREEVSVELDLPATWDEYLMMLDKKQRHEVRRKLRRLWEVGGVDYRCLEVGVAGGDFIGTFFRLFSLSRKDKADFMTAPMESFFRSMAKTMAEIGLLRFGMLELDAAVVAMVIGFDYNNTVYLYNSAYDPQYNSLSVGLLSKVLCIKESIERGRQKWDFLKGGEAYKYHIGGEEITLHNCQITIG
ncbi:GNAT family N-acetyltransferase [Chloroflexota bacterium]